MLLIPRVQIVPFSLLLLLLQSLHLISRLCLCSVEPVVVCRPSSSQLGAAVAGSELAVFVRWRAGAR